MNGQQTSNKEIVVSFDDTGSMHSIRSRVRRNVGELLTRLMDTDAGIRIGLMAHGDYCDDVEPERKRRGFYLLREHQLSADIRSLEGFVREVGPTGGEGPYAAYEYVLHKARSFNWTEGKNKALVLIGDEPPHDRNWPTGKGLDWRNEAAILKTLGVQVFTVQALNKSYATPFYRELAEVTGGFYLTLDQFDSISEILEAIAYKQVSDDLVSSFEERLFKAGRVNRNMDRVFGTLLNRAPTVQSKFAQKFGAVPKGLQPVDPSRFQAMVVDRDARIQDFVKENSLVFQTGKGFYELTKSETIQPYKEVVLHDKETGDMFTGRDARDIIGLSQTEEVSFTSTRKPWAHKYRVFVQSTSYTRKLIQGTHFLYEIDKNA